MYACGEGSKGRLGLGHSNNVSVPQLIKGLSQYVIKKVAIHSVGKHCLAINTAGKLARCAKFYFCTMIFVGDVVLSIFRLSIKSSGYCYTARDIVTLHVRSAE